MILPKFCGVPDFMIDHRGKIEAKNKGMIDMYFVEKLN